MFVRNTFALGLSTVTTRLCPTLPSSTMERIFQASPFRRNLTQFPDFIWGRTTLLFYNPDPVNVCRWESLKITRCDPVPEDASLEVDVVVTGSRWAVVAVLVRLSDHGRILNHTGVTGDNRKARPH